MEKNLHQKEISVKILLDIFRKNRLTTDRTLPHRRPEGKETP